MNLLHHLLLSHTSDAIFLCLLYPILILCIECSTTNRLISRLKSQPSSREGTVRISVVRVGHKSDDDGNFEACFEHHRLPKWDKLADELNINKGWSSETR